MYSFSTSSETTTANDVLFDRSTEPSRPASFETLRAQRKDALIRRLRSDKELLLVDPGAANETLSRREAYKAFLEAEIEGKGGVDGDELLKAVGEELGPNSKDSEALNATMNALGTTRSFESLASASDRTAPLHSPQPPHERGLLVSILFPQTPDRAGGGEAEEGACG